MRLPEIITTEIEHLNKISANAEKLSLQFPNDNILKLTFEQFIARRINLLKKLESSLLFFDKYLLKDV